ncbi:hypothetical protein OTU49_004907, partial [Cherax quadricarinatus]
HQSQLRLGLCHAQLCKVNKTIRGLVPFDVNLGYNKAVCLCHSPASINHDQLRQRFLRIHQTGSSTVGAGVTGVKWVAGTTYSVGAGVVGTAGSVVAGTAGTVASGASAVISKVTTKKKEHSD